MKQTYGQSGRKSKLSRRLAAATLAASFAWLAPLANAAPAAAPAAAAGAVHAQGPADDADYVYFYHHFKRYAEADLRERKAAGRDASMYYDNALKKWVVRVRKRGASSSSSSSAPRPVPGGSSTSSSSSSADEYYYYSFHSKANAESSLRSHTRMGKEAAMAYDASARKWVVRVRKGGASSAGDSGRRVPPPTSSSGGAPTLPPGATVLYFPTRENAEGIYKASLRQGDWAQMWYDAKRREWAVAVKPRLGGRRGRN